MRRLTVCLLGLATLGACKDDKDPFAEAREFLPPIGTRDGLVYVDRGNDDLYFVEPGEDAVDVSVVSMEEREARVSWATRTRDQSELLIMTVPESEKVEDVSERLYRYGASGADKPVKYDVEAPFDSVALSPDHRRAVLYFGGGNPDIQLHNRNQVSIVNLTDKNVRNFTLNGFGGILSSVHFPGQIEEGVPTTVDIGGFARDIVAFLANGEIVLVDMVDEQADPVAVKFTGTGAFEPVQTLLRPGDDMFEDPVLFLRSSVGDNVAMLTLVNKPDEVTGDDGFTAQISLISVGGPASDLLFYNGEEPYLVSLTAGGTLTFTDIQTQEGFEVPFEESASQMFLRDNEVPGGDTVRQVVAWTTGGQAIHTLDLQGIENSLGRDPHEMKIETGIDELVQLDNDRVLVSSGKNLYVVHFPADQVVPMQSRVPYDPAASALDGELLLLGTPGQEYVSWVELDSYAPESMLLDHDISAFHYAAGTGKMMVVHGDPVGHLTVVDGAEPSRSTSYTEWGFLLTDVLGGE